VSGNLRVPAAPILAFKPGARISRRDRGRAGVTGERSCRTRRNGQASTRPRGHATSPALMLIGFQMQRTNERRSSSARGSGGESPDMGDSLPTARSIVPPPLPEQLQLTRAPPTRTVRCGVRGRATSSPPPSCEVTRKNSLRAGEGRSAIRRDPYPSPPATCCPPQFANEPGKRDINSKRQTSN
jgi:hypothetical protein